MIDILTAKSDLLDEVNKLQHKKELSLIVGPDYYEPGMMENLDQYLGFFDEETGKITIRNESKGLRYDNRTSRLEHLNIGDEIKIERDRANVFNSNNFRIFDLNGADIGNMPAELCNAIAPLYDLGYLVIENSKVSYIEQIKNRSRYAKQGILFIETHLRLRGI